MQINSENIPEVTEVKEPTAAEETLNEALSAKTEIKAPSAASESTVWDFDKIAEEPARMPENEPRQNPAPEPGVKTPETEKKTEKTTDAAKRVSAETATLMWDQFLQLAGNSRVNSVFKKKFTIEEKTKILDQDLEDKKLDEVEEADKVLKRKFDRLVKKRDAKIKNIPLSEDETASHIKAFYHYFKTKDIEMPPEWALAFTLGGTFLDRVIEVEAD